MIGQPGFHCWCYANRAMDANEVIPREEQSQGRFKVRPLLAESVRQPGEAPQLHPHGQVASFDMRCADSMGVRLSVYGYSYRACDRGRRVTMLIKRRACIGLNQHRKAHVASAQAVNDGVRIRL